jgi:hypothetical protein
MSPDMLLTVRELAERTTDGIQVRLLWSPDGDRIWVAVLDTRSGENFCLQAREDDHPLELFHHPFAYEETRCLPVVHVGAVAG